LSELLREPAEKYLRGKLYFADVQDSVRAVAKTMVDNDTESVLVCRNGEPVGMLTLKDVLRLVAEGKDPTITQVSAVMSSPIIAVRPDEPVERALALMCKHNVNRIVVLDRDGRPLGLLLKKSMVSDYFDRQERSDESAKKKRWLDEYIEEITEHEMATRHLE